MPFELDKASRLLPLSLLCDPKDLPQNRPPRLISAMAFAPTLESSFSGSTFFLALAGLAVKKLEGCFGLYSGAKPLKTLHVRGALWKLARTIRRQKTSGFKFTSDYLDEVWPRYIEGLAGSTLVNNFQMYGRKFFQQRKRLDIGAYFYIDGTLTEYFETYADYEVSAIDPSTIKHAIEVEQEDYDAADGFVAMSELTARTLQQRYGVPPHKISIVVPGASLTDEVVDATRIAQASADAEDFVLGFVGLYPRRKGLDKLAKAVQIMRGRGMPVRLRVIGNCPDDLARMDGLDYLGRIDKRIDLERFVQAIGSVHLGCLVSRSELTGIAMLEFLRLGVPILGTRVGGAVDILKGGGSVAVAPDIDAEELAEVIAALYQDRTRYLTLKTEAEARRGWASWKRVAAELDSVLP